MCVFFSDFNVLSSRGKGEGVLAAGDEPVPVRRGDSYRHLHPGTRLTFVTLVQRAQYNHRMIKYLYQPSCYAATTTTTTTTATTISTTVLSNI